MIALSASDKCYLSYVKCGYLLVSKPSVHYDLYTFIEKLFNIFVNGPWPVLKWAVLPNTIFLYYLFHISNVFVIGIFT